MNTVHIRSTGSHLPERALTNDQLARLAGELGEDILAQVQVDRRHWVLDPATGDHSETCSEMAAGAARQALERARLEPDDVELLIVSTCSPDYPLPPMVTLVQDRLGLRRCAALELRSGCAGAVIALDVARLYLERGAYRNAVVIGCEAISPILAPLLLGRDPDRMRVRDRLLAYSFGDGAGAVVLEAEAGEGEGEGSGPGIRGAAIACVGGGRKPGMLIPVGGSSTPLHRLHELRVELRVDFAASGAVTPHVLTEGLTDLLRTTGTDPDSIDLCVIPEGNAGYLRDELARAGPAADDWRRLEARVFENLALVGNTGSAAVPLALDDAWTSGRLSPGDRVLLLAIETSKWIYAGMIVDWSAPPCPAPGAGA